MISDISFIVQWTILDYSTELLQRKRDVSGVCTSLVLKFGLAPGSLGGLQHCRGGSFKEKYDIGGMHYRFFFNGPQEHIEITTALQ